jgi:two-component system chemotaxis sensor kinase CheA
MDELLTQFLIESRELVDQVVDDLLALEKRPNDARRLDDAFRGLHTLKGGAGIVEFAAMQTAVHGAENALAAVRAEPRAISAAEIGNCLRCLDQVGEWLDAIASSGALPADADAAEILAAFEGFGSSAPAGASAPSSADSGWVAALINAHPAAAARAQTAVRYSPPADSFFRQEDPVARIAALPGLSALDLRPRVPWPPLEDFDPFSCNLTITALSASPLPEVAAALGDAASHCEVAALASPSLARKADDILAEQLKLLELPEDPGQPGRLAAAGLAAANVLQCVGRSAEADAVTSAAAVAVAEGRPEPLAHAIGAAVRGAPAAQVGTTRRPETAQTMRVSAERIDSLVRLTGELIVSKNALGHAVRLAEQEGSSFAAALKNQHAVLDRLVNELQRSVVATRVLPLRVAFQRFPRLVRELSAELKKPATLVLEGEDTEADKTIVETLVEPLVHVMRNALDHGVEDAAARAAAGKPEVATIRLRAARDGDSVAVEVTDDGAGIDVARVKQVAQARNLMTAEAAAALSDEQAVALIFLPGFSTSTTVTELSGRGVGMDAVRSAIARLGGDVEARSVAGHGTTVRFVLPFSVLVTQVMTVEAGGQLFGIPLDSVVETIRVAKESIFPVGAAHAIVLRDRTVPLVRLADVLAKRTEKRDDAGPIVVAQLGESLGAVQVDRVGERMDVILKPLDGLLADVPGVAGSTLLGDGSVLLVLDLAEIVR